MKIEEQPFIFAQYKHENVNEFDKIRQEAWDAQRHNTVIDLDQLESTHIRRYLEMCLDFFTGQGGVSIYFQSSKGRLAKVREIANKSAYVTKYQKLGKKGTISYGKLYE